MKTSKIFFIKTWSYNPQQLNLIQTTKASRKSETHITISFLEFSRSWTNHLSPRVLGFVSISLFIFSVDNNRDG